MKLYRKVVMNGYEMKELPFKREFELEGCLTVAPELLSLNDDDLTVSRLITVESFIRNKRRGQNHRPDMIVALSGGQIGIVELKKGIIDVKALTQLRAYLDNPGGLAEHPSLKRFKGEEG